MKDAVVPIRSGSESRTDLIDRLRQAVIWRSGSQIVAQALQWSATFGVLRLLDPADYGLFAMTQFVLMLLSIINGYGLANALVREPDLHPRAIAQVFGLLIAVDLTLAVTQIAIAPAVAAYYQTPMVADLLRVQSLIFVLAPFIALPQALLARSLEFRRQAQVNILASVLGAATALGGALAGWGVWALVAAPIVLYAARAVGFTVAARAWIRPSFDLRGSGRVVRYGGLVAAGQLFALIWSQADVVIGGRVLDPHRLGLYTTSLFLVQIVVSKFVPPLNEVAFAAYARLGDDPPARARAVLKLVRLVMVAAMPFYLGLWATAKPLAVTILGEKWHGIAPIVRVLVLSMPFYTVHVLLGPATDAAGRPGIATGNAALAALIAPPALLLAAQWGTTGLAATWLLVFPLVLLVAARRSLPVLGLRARALAGAALPPVLAAAAMAAAVTLADRLVPIASPAWRLAWLVTLGGAIYGGWLLAFARDTVAELIALVRGRY